MKNFKMFVLAALGVAVVVAGAFIAGGGTFLQGKSQNVKVPFTVIVAALPVAQNVETGDEDVNLAAWKIKVDRNLIIDELSFSFNGDKPEVIKNLVLKIGDQKIAGGVLVKKNVTFNDIKFSLENGSTNTIALYADIVPTLGNPVTTFQMALRQIEVTDSNTAKKYKQTYPLVGPVVKVL